MIAALAFLQLHSWKNHLLVRVRRLRQPKYLFGAIVGALYFYAYFVRHLFSSRPGPEIGNYLNAEQIAGFQLLGAFVLFLVVLMAWALPKKRAALNFNEAEVAFLFTAPISRKNLIHYKLITGQVGLLLTSIFVTLISGRFKSSAYFWMPLIAYWLLFATMSLHFLAASFLRTMLLDRGLSPKRWKIAAILVVVAIVTAVALSAKHAMETFNPYAISDIRDLSTELANVFESGITPYLLMPFRMLIQPLFAKDPLSFGLAVLPVLCVYFLQYFWVLRMNVAFEEASAEHSKKRAELVSAARNGNWKVTITKPRRAWFKLLPHGTPLIAIFWKNLISMGHPFQKRTMFILGFGVLVPMLIFANAARGSGSSIIGFMALMFLGWSVFIGPALMRRDFRQDFPNAEMLKLLPMRGWQIALGQLLTPCTVLTAVQWVLIVVAALFFDLRGMDALSIPTRLLAVLGLGLLLPLLTLVTMTIPNLAVLLFPAWFQTGRDAPAGIEATGQRLILMLGQFLGLTLMVLPVAGIGGVTAAVAYYVGGLGVAVVATTAVGAVLLAMEAALMIWWLGKTFEKLDLSKESSS